MCKTNILFILLLFAIKANAQIKLIDSAEFKQSIFFLERKLNYDYFSSDQKMWWINKLNYDSKNNKITIKNISTKSPGKILGKKYIVNSVSLSDLNPYNIQHTKTSETDGRFIKGQLISLHTVKGKSLVQKEINGRLAGKTSFIYLSFPEFMNEGSQVTDSVFAAFQKIIVYSTTIYNQTDSSKNFNTIYDCLLGNHQYQDINGPVKRYGEKINDFAFAFEDYQDRKKIRDVFFGYDPKIQKFYEFSIEINGYQTLNYFTLMGGENLILQSEDENTKIWFANKSKTIYENSDGITEITFLEP